MSDHPSGNQSFIHTRSRFPAILCRDRRNCLDVPSPEKFLDGRKLLADYEKDLGQRSLVHKLSAPHGTFGLVIFQYFPDLFPSDKPLCVTPHRDPHPRIHSHRGTECSRPLPGNPDRGLREDSILSHPYPDNYLIDINAQDTQSCSSTSLKPSEHQDFICPSSS